MRASQSLVALFGFAVLSIASPARAEIQGLTRVASGLSAPIFVHHAPHDPTRLFIVERGGSIRILDLDTGNLLPTPFLTTTVETSGEGGLLGLAFHPDYNTVGAPGFGKFYINVTTGGPFTTRIREFSVDAANPNLANASSLREILSIPQPQTNHNGGWIDFSPIDGQLYIATGDGGFINDSGTGHTAGIGNAQDTTSNLLGKMLRINPLGDDFPADATRNYSIPPTNPFRAGVGDPADDVGDDEIWSYGLRNPFRASFDRATGDLWIGDVGQSAREEIDRQLASSTGGENYGWRLREGTIATPSGGVGGNPPPGNVEPVYDYNRNNDQFGGTVVTGGYVYRGPDQALQGKYFFLDSRNDAAAANDNYWMFDPANPRGTVQNIDSLLTPNVGTPQFPVSFGEDAVGRLYIAYIGSGDVYRIITDDVLDLAGDYDGDNDVDIADYEVWRASFATIGNGTTLSADGNNNNVVDAADYVVWRKNFVAPMPGTAAVDVDATVPESATVLLLPFVSWITLRHRYRFAW
jgi:glucose/arabinose dehydrogenase